MKQSFLYFLISMKPNFTVNHQPEGVFSFLIFNLTCLVLEMFTSLI